MRHRLLKPFVAALAALVGVVVWTACGGLPPGLPENVDQEWHVGPEVHVDVTGPARFAGPLFKTFRPQKAMELIRRFENTPLAPGNAAFDAELDHVAEILRQAGFDGSDDRLKLEFIETELGTAAWTPVSAEVTLTPAGGKPVVLHSFTDVTDADRCMLPVYAPSCEVEGPVALSLADIDPDAGSILVTKVPIRQVLDRARNRGAAAVISASSFDFCEDPSGQERHVDAIQYRSLPETTTTPAAQISPRSFWEIELACMQATGLDEAVRISLKAQVTREERPLRTLVATIVGSDRPQEAVAIAAHAQEWGAGDNCSGVAGLTEGACAMAELLRHEEIPWPSRSLVLIWGDEVRGGEIWLEHTDLEAVAGISCDMIGESEDTGAMALLERGPDPGALVALPPDEHTPWGGSDLGEESLAPNGLAIIARCAMVDVGLLEEEGWNCRDHPWEGGSDHDAFLDAGVPAVLFWHFTSFVYQTSLDRIEFVDSEELRRSAVAVLATGLAVADAEPGDLDRYLKSLDLEQQVRVAAAREEEEEDLAEQWERWCRGARQWLRNLCLGIDEELPDPKGG